MALNGKLFVITGSAKGLGLGFAEAVLKVKRAKCNRTKLFHEISSKIIFLFSYANFIVLLVRR